MDLCVNSFVWPSQLPARLFEEESVINGIFVGSSDISSDQADRFDVAEVHIPNVRLEVVDFPEIEQVLLLANHTTWLGLT